MAPSGCKLVTALLALFGMILVAEPVFAATSALSGTVTYRERIALPRSARVEVELLDVSRADAPAITIATTTVKSGSQVPIRYRLRFNSAAIQPGVTGDGACFRNSSGSDQNFPA